MKTPRKSMELLHQTMISNDSLVCCGLDPDVSKIPTEFSGISSPEERVRAFLRTIVNLTGPHICAYKAQKAFFDIFPDGHALLKEIISYIHERFPNIPVFVDAKIGDVGNTMDIYLQNILDELDADGVVVNPYMGDDILRPFESLPDKAAIILVKTSNPDAAVVQDVLLQSGKPLWKHILELTVNRWNKAGNMIPVIASTADTDLSDVRRIIPDSMPVLFAGYGVQGGTTKHFRQLLDSTDRGIFVNSSRGLLYPYNSTDEGWRDKVIGAVVAMKDMLNFERSSSKFLLMLGVSGVGKSVIMQELRRLDSRFVYISPFMTRELRAGETDKTPITGAELDEKEQRGEILATNNLYGIRYATPKGAIEAAIREGKFPLLDWPITHLDVMKQAFAGKLFTVYVEPSDLDMLQLHLADGRDPDQKRFDAGVAELSVLKTGTYDSLINYRTVSREGDVATVADEIYSKYLQATGL